MQEQRTSDCQVRGLIKVMSRYPCEPHGKQPKHQLCTLLHSAQRKTPGEQDENRLRNPRTPSRRKKGNSSNSPKKQTQYMYSLSNQALREKRNPQSSHHNHNSQTYQLTASSRATENRAPRGLHQKSAPTESSERLSRSALILTRTAQ